MLAGAGVAQPAGTGERAARSPTNEERHQPWTTKHEHNKALQSAERS